MKERTIHLPPLIPPSLLTRWVMDGPRGSPRMVIFLGTALSLDGNDMRAVYLARISPAGYVDHAQFLGNPDDAGNGQPCPYPARGS